MNTTSQKVFLDAMSLSYPLRACLAKQLLESLDETTADERTIKERHLEIARQRLDDVRSGRIETISALDASKRIQRILEE